MEPCRKALLCGIWLYRHKTSPSLSVFVRVYSSHVRYQAYSKTNPSELGYMVNRRNRAFEDGDIEKITGTYHEWKRDGEGYQDIKGFCKSATLAGIEKHNFVLTPGRYVGIPDEVESEVSFEETMGALTVELAAQMKKAAELDAEIKFQLATVGFEL
jgi:type I restriction enzyme M protein